MPFYVYILASSTNGALYVRMTNDLRRRVEQHRAGGVTAHTRTYRIHRLVWFEAHGTLESARLRERRIKRWARAWKDALIEAANPRWRDLAAEIPL